MCGFMPPARSGCQPIMESQLKTWLLLPNGCEQQTPPSPAAACDVLWCGAQHVSGKTSLFYFIWIRSNSIETFGGSEANTPAPQHAIVPNPRKGTPRAVSWFPLVMKCSRRLAASTKKKT